MRVRLCPIGSISNPFIDSVPDGWETVPSRIILDEKWLPALDGIGAFSHLFILFWLSRIPQRSIQLQVHPQGRQDLPLVGMLATRTPYRPNPIGLQVVELLSVEHSVLTVRGLDALDGSPVVDIKPYLPRGDAIPQARTPDWLQKLWSQRP